MVGLLRSELLLFLVSLKLVLNCMQHSAIFAGFGTPRAMPKHSPWNSLARGPGPCRVKSSRSSNTVSKTEAGSFGLRATQPDEQNEKEVFLSRVWNL